MKGFIIYETPLWGYEENVVYLQEVKDASYTLKQVGSDDITCYLEGIATNEPVTKAECNKDDTYDFEMGALIALMKKCGAKKVAEACCEAFPHETSGSIYRENKQYVKRIKELKEENERLEASNCAKGVLNGKLLKDYNLTQSAYEIMVEKSADLIEKAKKLEEENEKLKLDCYKLQHGYNIGEDVK